MKLPRSIGRRTVLTLACLLSPGAFAATTPSADIPTSAPLKTYAISDFGAVPDGKTLNTAFIQKALDAAAAAGGGVVRIPAGTFRSGSIFLREGVELTLDEGAVLLGSDQIEDYPKRETRIEGHSQDWRMALVNAQGLTRVRISGKGQLNGNGAPFWTAFRTALAANRSTTNLDVERPRLMFIDRCADVHLEDLSFQDSGFWNLHLYKCHDVHLDRLHINARTGPSTDGMDIDSCQDVTVRGCQISCNDDNIALKGSKGPFAEKDTDSPPVENILVEDCEFGNGNGMITCGSEATIVRNVTVRNCRITGSATLLTLKLRTDTPQHYSNILIDGVTLSGGRGRVLNVAPWTQYANLQGQPPPVRSIDQVTIRNVHGEFQSLGTLRGNPGDHLANITLENFDVKLVSEAFAYGPADKDAFVFKNVVVNGKPYLLPPPSAAATRGARRGPPGAAAPGPATGTPTPATPPAATP